MKHEDTPLSGVHIAHNWSYANATTRLAATGFAVGDAGKLALQVDDQTLWMLSGYSPIAWTPVSRAEIAWDDVTEKPATFSPATHTHPVGWTGVTDKPTEFPPSAHTHPMGWADVTNKPTVFAPDTHAHAWSGVTDKPAAFPPESHDHAFSGLSDANMAGVANGQVPVWNSTSEKYEPGTPAAGASALTDLTDVNAPSPSSGQVLGFDGEVWKPVDQAGGSGAGGDVNGPGSSVHGSVPMFDGTTGKIIQDPGVITIDDGSSVPTGGIISNVVDQDGSTRRVHTFLSDGTFTIPSGTSLTCRALIVAAGGAGGFYSGGGGGGGGVVQHAAVLLDGVLPVVVGVGVTAANGQNSYIGALAPAIGGGNGASSDTQGPGSGGSGGGGAGYHTTAPGTGTIGQGYSGGGGDWQGGGACSGGGGGAGGGGGSAVRYTKGGDGGPGVSSDISGELKWYGGGGGGQGPAGSLGGIGGGGAGVGGGSPEVGHPNTGGGSGGSPSSAQNAGGAGIVIISYLYSPGALVSIDARMEIAGAINLGPGQEYKIDDVSIFDLIPASGMSNPMITEGDLIVAGEGGLPSRLGAGEEGQVLGVRDGVLTYRDPIENLADLGGVDFTTPPTTGQVLGFDGEEWGPVDQTGGSGGGDVSYAGYDYLRFADEKAAGTSGGSGVANAWTARTINVKKNDAAAIATLANNRITLPAGSYIARATSPFYRIGNMNLRLYDVTHSKELVINSGVGVAGTDNVIQANLFGSFILDQEAQIELQYQSDTVVGSSIDCGIGTSHSSVEVFSVVELLREKLTPVVVQQDDYILIQHILSPGFAPASGTGGSWNLVELNTVSSDAGAHVLSLAANRFTLEAGTYEFDADVNGMYAMSHKLKLRDITHSIDFQGQAAYSPSVNTSSNTVFASGKFTIVEPTAFELWHYTASGGGNTNGVSCPLAGNDDVIARIKLHRKTAVLAPRTRAVLYDVTLSVAGNFDVQNLSQKWDRLEIRASLLSATGIYDLVSLALNNDTADGEYYVATNEGGSENSSSYCNSRVFTAIGAESGLFSEFVIEIPGYSGSKMKTLDSRQSRFYITGNNMYIGETGIQWHDTSPINRFGLSVVNGFAAGSRLQIVGVKDTPEGESPAVSTYAPSNDTKYDYAKIEDRKAQNTPGGNSMTNAFVTRTLNTVVSDRGSIISLSSNRITLQPGWYRIAARVPTGSVYSQQARWTSISGTSIEIIGQQWEAHTAGYSSGMSFINGEFLVEVPTEFEIQHWTEYDSGTASFGIPANANTEIYTSVELWKEKTFAIKLNIPQQTGRLWHQDARILSGGEIIFHAGNCFVQNNYAIGDTFVQSFVLAAGAYKLVSYGNEHWNRGYVDWYIDDVYVARHDFYSGGAQSETYRTTLNVNVPTSGRHVLKGIAAGVTQGGASPIISLWYYTLIPTSAETISTYEAPADLYPTPVAPKFTDFTWVNQGGASVYQKNNKIYLSIAAESANEVRLLKKELPATPYIVTAFLIPRIRSENYNMCGIALREAATGKLHVFGVLYAGGGKFQVGHYSDASTWVAEDGIISVFVGTHPIWIRIRDDGTTKYFEWSSDGEQFDVVWSAGHSEYFVADEVGFFVRSQSASSPASLSLVSWKEE